MKKEPIYITHTCKNSKLPPIKDVKGRKISEHSDYCFNAFVDEDKHNSTTIAPAWKYCPECVAKGFKNPKKRIMPPPTEKQLEARRKFSEMIKNKISKNANILLDDKTG